MSTYENANQMMVGALEAIKEGGERLDSREGGCREVLGWSGRLRDASRSLVTLPRRRLDPRYAGAEVLWYLSMTGDTEMIRHYAPQYPRWTDADGRMYGGVGSRLAWNPGWRDVRDADPCCTGDNAWIYHTKTQLEGAAELLRRQPNTRQCVVALWDSGDLAHALARDKKNLPCYCSLQYFLRDGKLHAVTSMRSNDAWLGLPYDVFAFACLQNLLADYLGVDAGTYTHHVGSLHLYDKHAGQADEAVEEWWDWRETDGAERSAWPHGWKRERALDLEAPVAAGSIALAVQPYLILEEAARKGSISAREVVESAPYGSMLADLATCACADMPGMVAEEHVASPGLRALLEQRRERKGGGDATH